MRRTLLVLLLIVIIVSGLVLIISLSNDGLAPSNTQQFTDLGSRRLVISENDADMYKSTIPEGWNYVLAQTMGLGFGYDPTRFEVGSVGFDSNPNDLSFLKYDGQFLAVMNKNTLGKDEAIPYVLLVKNIFLQDGDYSIIESMFDNQIESVKDIKIGEVAGREYRLVGTDGYHLIFPADNQTVLDIQVFIEKDGRQILETIMFGTYEIFPQPNL
jgi:hypothetical protein